MKAFSLNDKRCPTFFIDCKRLYVTDVYIDKNFGSDYLIVSGFFKHECKLRTFRINTRLGKCKEIDI